MEGFVIGLYLLKQNIKYPEWEVWQQTGSYDIVMNECKWGNLKEPGVTVDTESRRNSALPKIFS